MCCSPDQDPWGMCQEMTGAELGDIPFYGTRGNSARAYRLGQRTRGGQGEDRGHPKPPFSSYHMRYEELSRACRLLTEIHTRLCKSLQATHYSSLERQRLHHQRRKEAHIWDAEASIDQDTNSSKSYHVRRYGLHSGSGLGATNR